MRKESIGSRSVSAERLPDDGALDTELRPRSFEEFFGQGPVVKSLGIYLEAARRRKESLDHTLFSGLPGVGKTTLAHLIAREMGAQLVGTSGPALAKAKDLVGLLTQVQPGDVLFIDEVHRLPKAVEEYLYSAMEDYSIDIVIDQGANARSVRIALPRFTLVAATTREGLLSAPFRGRFGILEKLESYAVEDLRRILERSCRILKVRAQAVAVGLLASRSRGIPRVGNRMLRRVRDLAQVEGSAELTESIVLRGLQMLGVDERGLDETDRKILGVLVRHGGQPVGVKTLSVSIGEEEETIEEIYEPYLIQQGFLRKTPQGRVPTPAAFAHAGVPVPKEPSLF
jgi:Holliday junction DNA helicase RuvB